MPNVTRKKAFILDGKALISFLKGDSAASYLVSILKQAESGQLSVFIPINSLSLIFEWAEKNNYKLIKINDIFNSLPIIIYNFDKEFINKTAEFNELHPDLSMNDAILITLAREKSATIITGDKNLRYSDPDISISWV